MTLVKRVTTVFRRKKMKKIIASAVGLALVGGVAVTTASAVESQFGGYWRTRFTYDDNLRGNTVAGTNLDGTTFAADNDTGSNYITDTRTRLYYTAKFSDNFKFVNKFEFDAVWGGPSAGYGDVGSDGKDFEIKNSYLDYTTGMMNAKVGVQGAIISRGFIFDDDFSGIVLTPDLGTVKIPILWATEVEDEAIPDGQVDEFGNPADGDVHMFSVMPQINLSDSMQLTPHVTYLTGTSEIDTDLYWVGFDLDMKFDAVSAWATAIYNGGEAGDADIEGFLVAAGADAGVVHGQAFYATGDEDPEEDDYDAFVSAPGSSYYWSEIMGLGVFDNGTPAGVPVSPGSDAGTGGDVTNIWAANVGVTLQPMDKLTAKFDVWYAQLAEENVNGDDELGIEFDAMLTYKLEDNLNLDFIFAYLIADDAIGDEDVMEGGVRVSLAF